LRETADVLVVGAGPAGCAAAEALTRGGARVALVERHREPGGKACGGGITSGAWAAAGIDGKGPGGHVLYFDALEVRTPLGRVTVRRPSPFLATVDRRAWAAKRIAMLRDLGVDVRLGVRLTGLFGRGAITDTGELAAGRILAADGSASRVRRLLGLPRGLVLRALQLRVPRGRGAPSTGFEVPAIWFHPREFGSGYAWAFPSAQGLRLGCGVSSRSPSAARLKDAFLAWLHGLGFGKDGGRLESGTIACGYAGHRFGRVSLAGDAAGLASPVTGEGIAAALASGAEAAREILEPGYASTIVPGLAARHRRTHDALLFEALSIPSFALAPLLLRIPALREAAFGRYVL
jgi:flavin-dependent dehydrogenase